MKKIMASVLAAAMIMGAGTATTFTGADTVITANAATEGTYEYLKYTAYDTYVEITGFNGTVTEVEIPEKINKLPVTKIAVYAFKNATNLERINIPEGVETIGGYAFYNCSSLTEVNLPNTLKTIDGYAFQKCISLEEILLPNSLTYLGWFAFAECAEMKKIVFPKGLSGIPNSACSNCTSLKEVVIENGASYIGFKAFQNCIELSKAYIPLSVIKIGAEYSEGHNNEITTNSFLNCTSLKDIYYAGSANQWNVLDEYSRGEFENATIHFEAKEIPEPLTPDVNRDGAIDASDASFILSYYAHIQTGGSGTIEEFMASQNS